MSACKVFLLLSTALTVYYAEASGNAKYTLNKPGFCEGHPSFPSTIQCAFSKKCLAYSQMNDGVFDCKTAQFTNDTSDEDRGKSTNENCKGHEDYPYNMTFQCVYTKVCLSLMRDHLNGRCDCCPDGDCNLCTDHSDEECLPSDWPNKFYCDGLCLSKNLWQNGIQECPMSCIEPDTKTACLAAQKKTRSAGGYYDMCGKLKDKCYPRYNCTTNTDGSKCLPGELVLDGHNDCKGNEDEDISKHPECSAAIKKEYCDSGAQTCLMLGGKVPHCRCRNSNGYRTCNIKSFCDPKPT